MISAKQGRYLQIIQKLENLDCLEQIADVLAKSRQVLILNIDMVEDQIWANEILEGIKYLQELVLEADRKPAVSAFDD